LLFQVDQQNRCPSPGRLRRGHPLVELPAVGQAGDLVVGGLVGALKGLLAELVDEVALSPDLTVEPFDDAPEPCDLFGFPHLCHAAIVIDGEPGGECGVRDHELLNGGKVGKGEAC
jgi:hypothetical protein